MASLNFDQSVIQGAWPNAKKKPFDDPRIRRAVHLAFERAVLVDVTKDVAPMMVGGFIYPFSDFATPLDLGDAALRDRITGPRDAPRQLGLGPALGLALRLNQFA